MPDFTRNDLHLDFTQIRSLRRVWEFGFNTCHAPIVMRTDVQHHMRRAHDELGMRYWRCHGTLSDDVGLVFEDEKKRKHYCFSGLKRILDAGLAAGVKPFFELSFMPSALAAAPEKAITYYRGITSPPADYLEWKNLIKKTIQFLADTYGLAELRRWYFEVWNEPNIPFWSGDQAAYFRLYREAVLAIKSVDSKLRVGGPATARGAWVADLLKYCKKTKTPIDFVSTHIYPSDVPFMEAAHGDVNLLGLDFLYDHFARVRREADEANFSGAIIWGEWNSSAGPLAENHDDANNSAMVAGALAGIEKYGDGSLFWNLTDIYEECNYHFAPFHGGYGLYTVDDVPKSAARTFEMFHRLLEYRVEMAGLPTTNSRGGIASTNEEQQQLALLLWNHEQDGSSRPWEISLDLGGRSVKKVVSTQILPGKGSAFEVWKKGGSPMTLTPAELRKLQKASEPLVKKQSFSKSKTKVSFTVQSGSAQLIEIQLK